MKRRKLLLFPVAFLGLAVALYALVMVPAVQRAVVLRVASRVPGLVFDVRRLSVGWGGAEVQGLEATYRGNTLRVPLLQTEYSGLHFLLSHELRVQRLAIPDFVLASATGTTAGEPPATQRNPAAAFAGFLAPIKLPFPVTVESAELSGRAELPDGRRLQVAVNGRLLAPEDEASPAVRLGWSDTAAAPGAVSELFWVGQLRIRETKEGGLSRLALDGVLAADAATGAGGRGLRVNIDVRREQVGGPEMLVASVRLPVAKPDEAPLLRVQVEHRPGDGRVAGDWSLHARRSQLAVLAPSAAWPEFTAEAQGRFDCAIATGDFSTTGHAAAAVSRLGQFRPELSGLESLNCQADFAVERAGAEVRLSKLEVEVASAQGPVLRLDALQPASYRLDTGEVAFLQPENDLLRVDLTALPVAWLQPLLKGCTVEGRGIVGTFAVSAAADGRRVVLRSSRPLVFDGLTVRRAGKPLLERARLSLSPRIEHSGGATRLLVPDLLLVTEAGDRVDGTLDLDLDAALALEFGGSLRGTMPTLLNPFSPVALGAVRLEADLAGTWRNGALALRTAKAALRRNVGLPVLAVAALQPFTVRLSDGELVPERPGDPAVRVEFGGLPLAWVQPWLGDTTVGGTLASGECRLQGAGRDWTVDTLRPLVFADVSLVRAGQPIVERLGGELTLRVEARDDFWTVERLDLQMRPESVLPGGVLHLSLATKQDAAGRGTLVLPLTVECADRHSQLRLEGGWNRGSAGPVTATVRLTGDTVFLRDFGWLAALPKLAPSEPTPAPKRTVKSKSKSFEMGTAKDSQAFWSPFGGRFEVEVQRLVLEGDEFTGLQAVAVVDERQLVLERFSGRSRNAPINAKFGLTFDAAAKRPYALQGSGAFPGFDLGAFLRAANPDEEPTIETVLDITAKLEGQGATLDELVDGLRGDFVLKGGPGVLRIKDKRVEKAQAVGSFVLGLLGKDKQKPAVATGSQLLDELREFRFESLDASLLRSEDLNLQFRTIDLRSADKRLTGAGVANSVAGRAVTEYPLQLELRLAGKDNFAALLDQVRLLDGTKDDLGYQVVRYAIPVTGTLVKPDWKKMLERLGAGVVFGK